MARKGAITTSEDWEKSISATVEDINRIHRSIERRLQEHISHKIEIGVDGRYGENWNKRAVASYGRDNEVLFYMQDVELGQRWGQRSGDRGKCPVNQIKPLLEERSDNRPWVAWRDDWLSIGNNRFILKGAAFTFFDGNLHEVRDQLFRAEWVQKGKGGNFGAQPHWHIDWPLLLPTSDDNVAGIHLAMAGWKQEHGLTQSPQCWQRTLGNDWHSLLEWASLTLEYSRDQLYRFYYS